MLSNNTLLSGGDDPLINLVLSGLSIYRWNTFPRIRSITTLDHLGFVAHIAVIIAYAREEKEGEKYDIGLLLKKILFSGFFTFFYSDISAEVKDRLRENSREIYEGLENECQKKLLAFETSDAIRADIRLIHIPSKEDDLISFAKMWASYHEVKQNAIVYPEAYENLMKNMRKRVDKEEFFPFLDYLSFDGLVPSDIERYLLVIHRLASSYRWNRSVRRYPISVLSHTFLITFFTYLIARESDIGESESTDMLLTALFHDIPEAITGDIITPTKKSFPGLEASIEKIEQEMVHENLIAYISSFSFAPIFERKMLTPWSESHGKLVKKADILSALHEARIEAPYSEDFQEVYEKMKEKLEIV